MLGPVPETRTLMCPLTSPGGIVVACCCHCRMQQGIKQASDAYARVAASIGSLERVVELHDRWVCLLSLELPAGGPACLPRGLKAVACRVCRHVLTRQGRVQGRRQHDRHREDAGERGFELGRALRFAR
jgi:hypothetical protein